VTIHIFQYHDHHNARNALSNHHHHIYS